MEPDLTLIPTDILIGFQGYTSKKVIMTTKYQTLEIRFAVQNLLNEQSKMKWYISCMLTSSDSCDLEPKSQFWNLETKLAT